MKFFKFLVAVGNFFLAAWVTFKVYGYYAPEVGFELPSLTFLNVIALSFVVSIFTAKLDSDFKVQMLYDKLIDEEDKSASMVFVKTIALLIVWLMSWIWYIILF